MNPGDLAQRAAKGTARPKVFGQRRHLPRTGDQIDARQGLAWAVFQGQAFDFQHLSPQIHVNQVLILGHMVQTAFGQHGPFVQDRHLATQAEDKFH